MASHRESSTVETDEPNPKVQKLNASASGADEPAGVEDHSTEDSHIPKPTTRAERKNARANAPVVQCGKTKIVS